jgi:hypothetical protein
MRKSFQRFFLMCKRSKFSCGIDLSDSYYCSEDFLGKLSIELLEIFSRILLGISFAERVSSSLLESVRGSLQRVSAASQRDNKS